MQDWRLVAGVLLVASDRQAAYRARASVAPAGLVAMAHGPSIALAGRLSIHDGRPAYTILVN